MDPLTETILALAKTLSVPPVTAAILVPLVIMMANRAAKLIPDDATGFLKGLRIAFVILGVHVKDNSGSTDSKED
jgi:hypothetical protein